MLKTEATHFLRGLTPKKYARRLKQFQGKVEDWEYKINISRPPCKQVKHLIEKMGGIINFAIAVKRHPDRIIYSWLGVTKEGKLSRVKCLGAIYTREYIVGLIYMARQMGVILTPEDFFIDFMGDGVLKWKDGDPDILEWWDKMEKSAPNGKLAEELSGLLEIENEKP
jgi:hypothetical protein